ncbi:hypothetical protein Fmac_021447 [Flemingia macrophylla]|uniref:ADP-ribosyl cyclase/cyclic ADP-ribose hydrolase n=1 Tax=Flemingia macrophylla TaxID=520843 RepID=A0ABD1LWX5_9FABA
MACTTIQTCSSTRTKSFDVFVSFRGEDTRNSFADHLFGALQRRHVVAFRDQTIKKGKLLEPELLQAIEGSRVFIVVFSKDYASSTWCLKELTKIVDWAEQTGRSILPVFLDVIPSEVRKQSGQFGNAFAEHEERFKDDLKMVKKWREALKAITDRCGWDLTNKPQYEEIEKIVEEVINILGHNQTLTFDDDLIDMHPRVRQLEELLNLGANEDVEVVGISGMGGIGKTTLATVLFNKISSQYDYCFFIDDVSKIYGNFGATGVLEELLFQDLNQENMEITDPSHGTMLERTSLRRLKALIVLDNVDTVEQLEKLDLHPKYLGAGSIIIIISRDSYVLRNYGVNKVYDVQLLSNSQALYLFRRKAFKSDDIGKDYQQLTSEVLTYANGLPLAIKVLGSFLSARDISQWRSALARLRKTPDENIMDVLRISYDGLGKLAKEVFLDIACFFYGTVFVRRYHSFILTVQEVKELLKHREFHPDDGVKVLVERSLITIQNNVIQIHDLLKELGRSIVREISPNKPRKWSRLWDYKDLQNVLIENKKAENLEAIVIEGESKFLEGTMDALSNMNELKFLFLNNVEFFGTLNSLSNELRYLSWHKYPFTCLPSSFHPDKLVELILPYSKIKTLWKDEKYLPNLRNLDLSYSENLIEITDLGGVPRLKNLILEGCVEIERIDPSIGTLEELTCLKLKNCKNLLFELNIISKLNSLEELDLSGCSRLLDKNTSVIQLLTSSLYKAFMFPFHFLSHRKQEDSPGLLFPYLASFSYLLSLDVSFCNLRQIPDVIGNLRSLVSLNLGGNKFVTLPTTIKELSKLEYLNLEHCKQLKYLPQLPTIIEKGQKPIHKYYRGIYIFDCPKLSEMERCYRMAFSWMMQNLEVHLQTPNIHRNLGIVIPGTQIPKWFNKQNVGGSISMDLSPVMDDPNWIGVACCILFVTRNDLTNALVHLYHWFPFRYCLRQHGKGSKREFMPVPLHFTEDLVTVELDHLFTVFFNGEELIQCLSENPDKSHDLNKLEFNTYFQNPQGLSLVGKNCGYRLLFKGDLQQFNPNVMLTGISSCRKWKLL